MEVFTFWAHNGSNRTSPIQASPEEEGSGPQARGCPLVGLPATPDLAAHVRRFTGAGWERADAKDMYAIYNGYIDPKDRSRYAALAQQCAK